VQEESAISVVIKRGYTPRCSQQIVLRFLLDMVTKYESVLKSKSFENYLFWSWGRDWT